MKYGLTLVNLAVLGAIAYFSLQPVLNQKEDLVTFYDGTFAFDSRDSELGRIVTDIGCNKDGDQVATAEVVIPIGCSILAMKRFYTIGVYYGPVTVISENKADEQLDYVMFVIEKGVDKIKFNYPIPASSDRNGRLFLGDEIKGELRFQ